MTQTPPPEPPSGQDNPDPNFLLAVLMNLRLLHDLDRYLDPDDDELEPPDLRLRIRSALAVWRRVRDRLEGG
jgi:hypothetical protein